MAIELKDIKNISTKYKETHSATLYRNKNHIYKILEKNILFYIDMINSIKYNYSIHDKVNPHIILPTNLVVDDNLIRGYECDFVKGKNFENLLSDLNTEEKIIVLNEATNLLNEIHEYLIVGDVNLANCMYDKNLNPYLIDFDLSTALDRPSIWLNLYNFRNKNTKREILSNYNTDRLKMAIIVVSVLYEVDFERSFIFKKPYSNWDRFYQNTDIAYLKDYFKQTFHDLNSNTINRDYLYIPDSELFISDLDKDKKKIRGLMK